MSGYNYVSKNEAGSRTRLQNWPRHQMYLSATHIEATSFTLNSFVTARYVFAQKIKWRSFVNTCEWWGCGMKYSSLCLCPTLISIWHLGSWSHGERLWKLHGYADYLSFKTFLVLNSKKWKPNHCCRCQQMSTQQDTSEVKVTARSLVKDVW